MTRRLIRTLQGALRGGLLAGSLAGGVMATGCVTTETVSVGGVDYLVADASIGAVDYVVVAVARGGIGERGARRSRAAYERVARPRLAALCARRNKRPSVAGLTPIEREEFSVEDGFPTWSFGRLCA